MADELCPLCRGKWPDDGLRQYKNVLANHRGHIYLNGVQLTFVKAARRPGGVTIAQAIELAGVSSEQIRSTRCILNKYKLNRIGYHLVNVLGPGCQDALYVFREVE